LERWRAGDQVAAEELHRRYAQRLCALAEREIGRRLARRVGADDVVQSVFRTFFRRTAAGEFVIDHSGSLWQLLASITINKVRRQGEYHHAAKRNVAAEDSTEDVAFCPEVFTQEPGPDEAAMLADEIEATLKGLKPDEAEMFQLALQGHTTPELAQRFHCSRWTVRRVLDRIGYCLEQRLSNRS
jgi:RNA polymerase sigma factor (sigma-70 family)